MLAQQMACDRAPTHPSSPGQNTAAAFVACRGLVKRFGNTTVVNDVTFSLQRGECLALLGPSGCGKSTLLNMLAGILDPDEGSIECDGQIMVSPHRHISIPMRKRRFAMVFQDFSLWPHMTAAQNVAFGLKVTGVPKRERAARTARALQRVQMQEFADRHPSELSGGQQQRIAIARALVIEPRLLLLDEPLSALDAQLREDLRDELASLIRDLNMTSILVTHDQLDALAIADRIAVMHAGRIEQIGTPTDIYNSPASPYVAGFVGTANLYQCTATDTTLTINDGEELPLPRTGGVSGMCMIRRESICISEAPIAASPHAVQLNGMCRRCTFLGDRYEVVAETKGRMILRGLSETSLPVGSVISISFPDSAIHFLP